MSRGAALGKVLYGALFTLALPAGMLAWARATAGLVRAPAPRLPLAGALLVLAGAGLLLSGMWALWRRGGGLPMNAFPPPRLVSDGAYALVPHPIYLGFCAATLGVSLGTASASGLWLVTPTACLGCLALVYGYERDELRARLGAPARRPWLSLPEPGPGAPSWAARAAVATSVVGPWLLGATALARVVPPDALEVRLGFERGLPLLGWAAPAPALALPLFALAPLAARTASDLRRLGVEGLGAMAVAFPAWLVLPLAAPAGRGLLGGLAPSAPALLALLAADAWASRALRARGAARALAVLVAAAGVAGGTETLAGVLAALAAWWLVKRRLALWERLRRAAERLANSFAEVRLGPVRVINYAGWAALSTFVLVGLVGVLLGPRHLPAVLVASVAGLVGAAAWAQLIEGSAALARPYGFYGGLLGIVAGALAAPWLGTPAWWLLGACAVAGPVVQALGRLRCLVQGCCHGKEAPASVGIRVTHPRTRVCALSDLAGVPIHPTPLYSMLWNGVTALVLARLWTLEVRPHVLGGLFLLLNGLGRFVEEAYRGEPQTPVYWRLRLYQWVAIASAVAGALLTALGASDPWPAPSLDWRTLAAAAGFGLLSAVAAGVDFPESTRRFSRLAGADPLAPPTSAPTPRGPRS